MAFKKYAYYNKANQIAIIEQSALSGTGRLAVAHCTIGGYDTKDTCEAAGGQWIPSSGGFRSNIYEKYSSPSASVANGLEIEYTYSPFYRAYANAAVDVNKFYVNGWTVIGGYLTFLRARLSTITNWTSSPESAVTSGSSGDTGGQSVDYIVVGGSSRWNGLHKVQTAGTEGQLVTYTKVSQTLPYWEDQNVDFNTSEEIFGRSGGSLYLADYFSSGDHVFISGSNDESNNGLFSVSSVTQSATVNSSKLTLGTKYNVVNSADSTTYSTGLDNEYSADAALGAEVNQTDINIYKAHRDFSYVLTDVDVLDDESFELDVTRAQGNAIVYYIKAKMAEDIMDIEKRQYFMRLFKKQLEESLSSRKYGAQMIQGFWGMRK